MANNALDIYGAGRNERDKRGKRVPKALLLLQAAAFPASQQSAGVTPQAARAHLPSQCSASQSNVAHFPTTQLAGGPNSSSHQHPPDGIAITNIKPQSEPPFSQSTQSPPLSTGIPFAVPSKQAVAGPVRTVYGVRVAWTDT
ncbi:hypothetical protein CMEL01_14852 [Colletotrichum melonis]|uniref:Uncharacterized protein n=1 Tax=Colletotrichum melonis TaxID=1209925 RepID=A0AAI9UMS6_9PEZI|nr:hypothetical protein CMEL01_14852 [Colletotrichum melonis]